LFLVLVLVIICEFSLRSQSYADLLKITASGTGLNKFDSTKSASSLTEYGADLTAPVMLNDKNNFLTGVIYENINTKLFPNEKNVTFSSIALKVGLSSKLSEKLTGTFVLLPKLSSNFGPIGSKDFQIGGIALFKFQKNEQLSWKYGIYYNSELFGPFFVPILGMYYQSQNKKLELNMLLPLQVDFNYQLIPLMNAGINFNGQMRSYHLTNVSPGLNSSYLTRSTNELYAYLRFNFGKSILLYTRCGQSFARYYRVYNDNDKVSFGMPLTFIGPKRTQLNTDFSDGLIFQIGITYRVAIK